MWDIKYSYILAMPMRRRHLEGFSEKAMLEMNLRDEQNITGGQGRVRKAK